MKRYPFASVSLRNTQQTECTMLLPPPLPRLFFFSLLPLLHGLIISAPEACGGTHVVTHAMAFFGPKPGTSDVRDVSIFAPRAQADGVYLRRTTVTIYKKSRAYSRVRLTFPSLRLFVRVLVSLTAPYRYVAQSISTDQMQLNTASATESAPERKEVHLNDANILPRDTAQTSEQSKQDRSLFLNRRESSKKSNVHVTATEKDSVQALRKGDDEGEELRPNASQFSLFNACTQLSVPADLTAMKGRVAVVTRGVCDFAQKVGFMQDAGAVGVIVVNFKDGGEKLANMKLNDTKKNPKPIDIPAVMISYKDWTTIEPCRNDTKVVFTAEGEATFDIDYGREALNWAMMRGMALWILCQCGVNVVRYKRRVSEFRARADAIAALPVETYTRSVTSQHEEAVTATAEESSNEALDKSVPPANVTGPTPSSPIVTHDPEIMADQAPLLRSDTLPSSSSMPIPSSASTVVEEETGDEDPVCAVCLEEFEDGQEVRLLACSHLYHRICIDPWLQSSSNSCPLCKREVPNLPPLPSQMNYGSMIV